MSESKPFPFTEVGETRTFPEDVDPKELQWHWDEQDRIVTCWHETDWLIQLDNELPERLEEGVSLFITAGEFHRIIKGTGPLTVQVIKYSY